MKWLIGAAAAIAAAPMTASAMPRPDEVRWTCGQAASVGLAAAGGRFALRDQGEAEASFSLAATNAATAVLVSDAVRAGGKIVVGHERDRDAALIVASGQRRAPCWQIEAAGRAAYARDYDEWARGLAPIQGKLKPVKLQRLKAISRRAAAPKQTEK